MVSKSCEIRLKLERHYAGTLDCLWSPVCTKSTSSALCLFLFLALMGSSAAAPTLTPTAVLCLSLHQLSELSRCACKCGSHQPAGLLNHPGCAGRLQALKCPVSCSSSLSSDKPLITLFIWYLPGSFPVLLHLLPSAQPIMGRCQNFSFGSQI